MAAGIPGVVAGIDYLVTHYGQLSLQDILAPAIQQAKNGFIVTERYQKLIRYRKNIMQEYTGTASIFLKNNKIPKIGDFIVQNDLAKTLSMISENGSKSFYRGIFAQKMVNSVQENGGIWETYDLEHYKIIEREPVTINYKGIKVTSVPPPSSGGVVLGQALNILEKFDLTQYDGVTRKHIIIEAMRRAYRDRAAYLGDSDFVDIPINRLLDKNYAEGLALTIDANRITPSKELGTIAVTNSTGTNTTHFSVLDKYGNRVASTLSINLPFGSGFVVEGTGVLLNNEMDDFTIKPFTANTYGLVGYQANTIHPGKRPLSSMTPTFVESGDRIGILGTPGGSRIISMVLLAILDFAAGELPESWVNLPRYHHQYIPDLVQYEKGGLSKDEKRKLILNLISNRVTIKTLISNRIIFIQSSFILFLFLTLGLGTFIPFNYYPDGFTSIIGNIPLSIVIGNIQAIITHNPIQWVSYFLTIGLIIIIIIITLIISHNILRKI